MIDTTTAPQSDEWVKTLCSVIKKELASINVSALCSEDTEADLYRRFVNPASDQSQVSRAKFEIFSAVSQRRRELVMRDVADMMRGHLDVFFISTENVPEVSKDTAVDMAMNGFMCDEKDDRTFNSNACQKLEEIDEQNKRLEVLVPWIDHEAERSVVQSKIDALNAKLLGMGTLVKERTALFGVLVDFLYEFHAVGRDWSPVLEEHDLLKPLARYIYESSIHNSFTTKFLLLRMFDMISRPTHNYLKNSEKHVLLNPNSTLLISGLCYFGVFNAKFEGLLGDALWVGWLLFFGWSVLRYYDYTKAKMIRARIDALVENFKWLQQPITCDGEEMIRALHKIRRLGLNVPSIMYPLMRLLVPGAQGLYRQ